MDNQLNWSSRPHLFSTRGQRVQLDLMEIMRAGFDVTGLGFKREYVGKLVPLVFVTLILFSSSMVEFENYLRSRRLILRVSMIEPIFPQCLGYSWGFIG